MLGVADKVFPFLAQGMKGRYKLQILPNRPTATEFRSVVWLR
ncbi:hypothetical protein B6N60_04875 [Richelia sinica FACHB-800]|uniref:Uncharacterized protein n=1 Tax=Richelia sinica FACHB-800 TaxID=1357546 RepID=A0A975Y7B4_9NOST|nr:hypothetical protein B6N60_04875 [Richelia sinica FACHB-800]